MSLGLCDWGLSSDFFHCNCQQPPETTHIQSGEYLFHATSCQEACCLRLQNVKALFSLALDYLKERISNLIISGTRLSVVNTAAPLSCSSNLLLVRSSQSGERWPHATKKAFFKNEAELKGG